MEVHPVPITSTRSVMCRDERFRLYIDEDTLRQRTQELGERISRDYEGKRPIFIGILNGAFMFLADLLREVNIDCEVDFMKLSSYGDEKVSSGRVDELKRVDADLEGRHVVVVEDIVDTGLSMEYMLQRLGESNPASVRTAVLLHKYEATKADLDLDYVAFKIPNLFVIGYGLDYGQLARNLKEIYILDES